MLANAFEQMEGNRRVVDELPVAALADTAPDDELPVVERIQSALLEYCCNGPGFAKFKHGFHTALILTGADQGFVRALTKNEFESADNHGLTSTGFAGYPDQPWPQFPDEFIDESEISDLDMCEHADCGTDGIMQGLSPESMAAKPSFTFLGTGTSVGVPVIGCGCEVCVSKDPCNKRTRSSALLRYGELSLLIDSGPDLREQSLREGFKSLDAVIYTHEHVDHVVGFDELRAFCWRRKDPLPLYASRETLAALERMFRWAFSNENKYKGYVRPEARVIEGPFEVGDVQITPLPVEHGAVKVNGYRFDAPEMKSIVYMPDVKRIPESTLELMQELDVLVIDALRDQEHATHFTTAEALGIIDLLQPKQAWLTHLSHENEHTKLEQGLPKGVLVAHDGLVLDL